MINNRLIIAANGQNGIDGLSGHDGSNSHSIHIITENGGNGTDGTDGQHAGDVNIAMSANSEHIIVTMQNGERQYMPLGDSTDELRLEANGGKGGNGGRGGDGGMGARGANGHNATECSHGGNGENGSNGGHGGNAGFAANGGNAGNITVSVNASDTDLLKILAPPSLLPGMAGTGGRAGFGGRGGEGGAGGHSHSWTTTSTHTRMVGKTMQTYTEYHHHTSPGGHAGSNGSAGRDGLRSHDGKAGLPATFTIFVGNERYPGVYNMHVSTHETVKSDDAIIEPGEALAIYDLKLANNGAMPTPALQPVLVSLKNNRWISFNEADTTPLHGPIQPAETKAVAKPVLFKINPRPDAHVVDNTFHETAQMEFKVVMSRVNHTFEDASKQCSPLQIRYPAEISSIASETVIAKGEEAPFAIQIRNVSSRALGMKAPMMRCLAIEFSAMLEQQEAGKITFLNAQTLQTQTLDQPVRYELDVLNPNESVIFSGTLQFPADTPSYQVRNFSCKLLLGQLHQPDTPEIIQERRFHLQVADRFEFDPEADIVLVANDHTSKNVIEQWRHFAEQLGTLVNIWNVSLYKGFSYTQKLHGERSFMDQMKDKIMVILNDTVNIENQHRLPTDMLDEMEILEAAKRADIATYIVGGGFNIADAIKPAQQEMYPIEAIETHKLFNRRPDEKEIMKRADDVIEKLQKENPDRRYVTVVNYQPECLDSERRTLRHRWKLGTIETRETLNQSEAHIIVRNTKQPDDIDLFNVIKLMSFEKKLNVFLKNIRTGDQQTTTLISKVILSDLTDEMLTFAKDKWNGDYTSEKLAAVLTKMQALHHYNFPAEALPELRNLLLRYEHLAEQIPSGYDKHLFPLNCRRFRLNKVILENVHDMLARYFPNESFKEERNQIKAAWGNTDRLVILQQSAMPYNQGVQYDNHVDVTKPMKQQTLRRYERRESMFMEDQNLFGRKTERNQFIAELKADCKFEL